MIRTKIVPAIIPTSLKHLRKTLTELAFVHEIHVDVVDGSFVPATSWPYSPKGEPTDAVEYLAPFTLEVDLMVTSPIMAAEAWVKAGANMLVFHVESCTAAELAAFRSQHKVSIGVSALNDTPVETLMEYLPHADYVQLMGIATIGAQGQPFDERIFSRMAAVQAAFPDLEMSIDGSVNESTLVRLSMAGADRCIVGSAIVKADEPFTAYTKLLRIIAAN